MRIALVTEVWHPTINGVVTRLNATVDELCRGGHQVLVIAPRPPGPRRLSLTPHPGLIVRTVPAVGVPFVYGGQAWGLPLPRVSRFLDDFQPDVVHVASPAFLGIAGVAAARRHRLPLVCSYHTDIAAYAAFYHLGWLRAFIWWALRTLHGKADINLVTSHAAGAQLRAQGIGRVRLWPRGVDLERFGPSSSPPATRRPCGLTLLYVGRLAQEKGLGRLAELASLPNSRLIVVGDGPAREQVTDELQTAFDRHSSSVLFRGALSGDDLAAAYRHADMLVFPSITDTLGLVILEALASGLPVVAADSPASRETLGGCQAARLWQADAPGALTAAVRELAPSATHADLAACARSQVVGMRWSDATTSLIDAYRAATSRRHEVSNGQCPARRQLPRFAAVGAANAVIDMGVFNLLSAWRPTSNSLTVAAYNTVAVVLALANSWWWNSRGTFASDNTKMRWPAAKRRVFFAIQGALNVAVNDAAVVVAAASLTSVVTPVIATNLSKLTGMLTASAFSFAAMRLVIFRHARSPTHAHHKLA